MESLSIFEEKVLAIIRQLEHCCEVAEQQNPEEIKENKILKIGFDDIDLSVIKETKEMYAIEKYLQKNGVDFHLEGKNIIDRFMLTSRNKLYLPPFLGRSTQIATIGGENIQDIKMEIRELIKKLSSGNLPEKSIGYNTNLGQFIFDGKDTVEFEGKQKDVTDCLMEAGREVKVSWDAINEKMEGVDSLDLNKHEIILTKKSVHGAVIEINEKTERYLEKNKPLIGFKDNEYWLQYEVKRDG
jgi:hypothetical protein